MEQLTKKKHRGRLQIQNLAEQPQPHQASIGNLKKIKLRISGSEYDAFGNSRKLPETLSFEKNSGQVLEFLKQLRTRAYLSKPVKRPSGIRREKRWIGPYTDFTTLKSISPAAALVLAAEHYRIRHVKNRANNDVETPVVDFSFWDKDVVLALYQLGFLELLNVNLGESDVPTQSPTSSHILKFMTGNHVIAEDAECLRDGLANLTEKFNVAQSAKLAVYDGLCEAMTNTVEHAYQFTEDLRFPYLNGQWWMTGSVAGDGSQIDVIFFDQGVSIPGHLPRSGFKEHFRAFLRKLNIAKLDDGEMIKAAMQLSRSAMDTEHRGRGLPQIQQLIKFVPFGRLRILSRRGEYVYEKRTHAPAHVQTKTLTGDIGGTLIHWHLAV